MMVRAACEDWSAYNKAQATEGTLFPLLLEDLCSTIPLPTGPRGRGRPPVPDRDLAYASILKVYSQLSLRRAQSLLDRAARNERIGKVHYNRVSDFLNREDATPLLQDLLRLSALPVAHTETRFAIDSTGFRTSNFGEYNRGKHREGLEHKWLKLHACSGVKTNIITEAQVTPSTGKGTGDTTWLAPLVEATSAAGFTVQEVSADKAYSSRKNHTVVGEVGGRAFIPFKKNAIGRAHGSPLWKKAYHFFKLHEEEFLEHYHKRSNVESTIGAVKAKFGENLKSRNDTAQVNELYCKLIAYNITVLTRLIHQANLMPNFTTVTENHANTQ